MSEYRILVCGDRHWEDLEMISVALRSAAALRPDDKIVIVHGCARGADTLGGIAASQQGFKIERHPALWDKYGKAAGPIRNQEMLDTGIDLVLAFHDNIEQSRGTKHMIDISVRRGVKVALFKHARN